MRGKFGYETLENYRLGKNVFADCSALVSLSFARSGIKVHAVDKLASIGRAKLEISPSYSVEMTESGGNQALGFA